MAKAPLRILQINSFDLGGGAEKVAWNLLRSCRDRGHESWLAVAQKRSTHPYVQALGQDKPITFWSRLCRVARETLAPLEGRFPGAGRLRSGLRTWANPRCEVEQRLGIEDFNFPATWHLLQSLPQRPDIVHCHNLHGRFFDLRALPSLSRAVPTVLTLHDAWLLSGHCAHSFACERWQTGCGLCPDLNIPPAIRRDATAFSWRRKRALFGRSKLHVATPSRWLLQKVERSILVPGIVEARIIPNGVDRADFHPANKATVRAALDIPGESRVLLFASFGVQTNPWKDFQTLREAVSLLARTTLDQPLIFIVLGVEAPAERMGKTETRFVAYQNDPATVARYYQVADVYLHAARADTFPFSVIEALACGTPVVATAVGGIPEQVKGATCLSGAGTELNCHDENQASGCLTPPGDAPEMARVVAQLLKDEPLRRRLAENAAADARQRFDLDEQIQVYLSWYERMREIAANQLNRHE